MSDTLRKWFNKTFWNMVNCREKQCSKVPLFDNLSWKWAFMFQWIHLTLNPCLKFGRLRSSLNFRLWRCMACAYQHSQISMLTNGHLLAKMNEWRQQKIFSETISQTMWNIYYNHDKRIKSHFHSVMEMAARTYNPPRLPC